MSLLRHLLLSLAMASLLGCGTINRHYDAAKPHHRPDGFVNSDPAVQIGNFPWYEILWRRTRGDFRPAAPPAGGYEAFAARWTMPVDQRQLFERPGPPRLTWLGHASLLLQAAGMNILIDPQLSDHAGPTRLLSASRRIPPALTVEELPPIDLVLISHNHYDHLDHATIERLIAAGHKPKFLVPLGVKAWFDDLGIANVQEMDWWDQLALGELNVHFTPAQHWSKRTPFDTNATLWGGFFLVFTVDGKPFNLLYTGDTGYSDDFRAIRERLGSVDFLAVPVGAYEPRDFMRAQHANPADAVRILLDLGARQGIGVHWGSFELTREAFDEPPRELAAALAAQGLAEDTIALTRQGETRKLSRP